MRISRTDWEQYITRLSRVSSTAAKAMQAFIGSHPAASVEELIQYAYTLTTRYGEAAAALACEMYDAMAAASGVVVPAAEPAEVATVGEVAGAVRAVQAQSPNLLPAVTERMVKRAAADTTLKNAIRDGAEFAWVPHGDTCPFCITLASNGWQKASRKALKGGHAQHIHSHCDCEYAIRFDSRTEIDGYDPDKYLQQYRDASDGNWRDKVNAMRREDYAARADEINAQKRAAYAQRKTLTSGVKNGIIQSSEKNEGKAGQYEPDIRVPFGVGAKAKDILIKLPTGERVPLTPGERITKIQVIAGKGRERQIDIIDILLSKYPGTKAAEWQKKKGFGYIDYHGESYLADIHWYEEPSVGRVDYKLKPDADGNWFYED